jgi:hypothetical protein
MVVLVRLTRKCRNRKKQWLEKTTEARWGENNLRMDVERSTTRVVNKYAMEWYSLIALKGIEY